MSRMSLPGPNVKIYSTSPSGVTFHPWHVEGFLPVSRSVCRPTSLPQDPSASPFMFPGLRPHTGVGTWSYLLGQHWNRKEDSLYPW